jgi:hypothetical protein
LPDIAPNFGDNLVAGILANYSAMPKRNTQLTRISADRETFASADAFFASGEVLAKLLEQQDILRDYATCLEDHVLFFDHCRTGGANIPHQTELSASLWNSRNFGDESSGKECSVRSLAGMVVILTELNTFC